MKMLALPLFALALSLTATAAEIVKIDDFETEKESYSQYLFKISDINARTVGPVLLFNGGSHSTYKIRILCTDVSVENCGKFRFIESIAWTSSDPKYKEYETQGKVYAPEKGPFTHEETRAILQEFGTRVESFDFANVDLHEELRLGSEMGKIIPIGAAYQFGLPFLLTGIVTVPVGYAYDVVAYPFNKYRIAKKNKKGKATASKVSKEIKETKSGEVVVDADAMHHFGIFAAQTLLDKTIEEVVPN